MSTTCSVRRAQRLYFPSTLSLLLLLLLGIVTCHGQIAQPTGKRALTVESLLKRRQKCQLPGGKPVSQQANYSEVSDAAYAYRYVYPKKFKEIITPTDHPLSDTLRMVSPDHHARIIIWPSETIPFPLGAIDASLEVKDIVRVDSVVSQAIVAMKYGRFPHLCGAAIDYICHGINGYNHSIGLVGHNARQVIVCKVIVSEQPVSGDLVFNNLVFIYDKKFAHLYQAISLTVANSLNSL